MLTSPVVIARATLAKGSVGLHWHTTCTWYAELLKVDFYPKRKIKAKLNKKLAMRYYNFVVCGHTQRQQWYYYYCVPCTYLLRTVEKAFGQYSGSAPWPTLARRLCRTQSLWGGDPTLWWQVARASPCVETPWDLRWTRPNIYTSPPMRGTYLALPQRSCTRSAHLFFALYGTPAQKASEYYSKSPRRNAMHRNMTSRLVIMLAVV